MRNLRMNEDWMERPRKTIEFEKGRVGELFGTIDENSSLVVLNTFKGEGENIFSKVQAQEGVPGFVLLALYGMNWNDDLTPWRVPPIQKKGEDFKGLADSYLDFLLKQVLPRFLEERKPKSFAIAGYSLAGLFALYSIFRTDLFRRVACGSGSFWYPGFSSYVETNSPLRKPDCVYLSLGDLEKRTRNPFLQSVEEETRRIEKRLKELDIDSTFVLNKGNHFQDAEQRMADGIAWILKRMSTYSSKNSPLDSKEIS